MFHSYVDNGEMHQSNLYCYYIAILFGQDQIQLFVGYSFQITI